MFALTGGSLKEVLLVLLAITHQPRSPEALNRALLCLEQMSFIELTKFVEEAMSKRQLKVSDEQEAKIEQVIGVTGVLPDVARKALQM